MRAMSRTASGQLALVELKAVDNSYPLYGSVELESGKPLADAIAKRGDAFGAAVDPALLARLDLKPGARLTIGTAAIEITAVIKSEPDKLAAGIAFGPRVIASDAALRATGLLQPGSLVRWNYRLRMPDGSDTAVGAVIARANAEMPDAGWEIRTRSNASPALERNVERFTQFLTLVGLTALLVGGVGVANAVKSHLDRKRAVIATMKSLGEWKLVMPRLESTMAISGRFASQALMSARISSRFSAVSFVGSVEQLSFASADSLSASALSASSLSAPSLSASGGHPLSSTALAVGVRGHLSRLSGTPS